MKMKGQLFTFDLAVSMVIFLSIILFAVYLYGSINSSAISELESSANIVSSKILSKNYGSENILDKNLLLNLSGKNYAEQRKTLGIAENFYMKVVYADTGEIVKKNGLAHSPVAYIARQYPDDVGIMRMLNNTGVTWDFYWEESAAPPVGTTARHFYGSNDKVQTFKWLVANLSNYDSVISEDTHVKADDLTAGEQQKLRDFVNAGGIFFHVQHNENLISVFGPMPVAGSDKGIVKNNDDALVDVAVGTNLTFQQGSDGFSTISPPLPLKVLIQKKDDPNRCLFCKWTSGAGAIYFIPDINTTNPNGVVPGLKIIGDAFEFGIKPDNSTHAASSRRVAKLDNDYVYLDLIVWR